MAILKIYSDITSKEDKVWYQWFGLDAVCFEDVDDFCNSIPEDDNEIDIRIFCNGGSCMEGWAMYDRLRQTGKDISVTVEGKAASMATVIMMAAPKEKRKCYQNASLCVHNPWMDGYHLGQATADDLQKAADNLREEQNRILDLYVERCGCNRDEMQALMDEDKYIDPERAKELGLVGEILQPISASKSVFNDLIIKARQMEQNKTQEGKAQVSQGWLDKVLAFFGKTKPEDVTFDITLSAADGTQITVEREEGEPQVGDKASPDGSWLMPEGETIVIDGGYITEIIPADQNKGNGEGGASGMSSEGRGTENPLEAKVTELQATVAQLEAERDQLQAQLTEAQGQVTDLQAQLQQAQAKAITEEQQRLLNALELAGGEAALAQISSQWQPQQREPKTAQVQKQGMSREEGKNAILSRLNAVKGKK